jgi:tRNA (cmo5U34)-methyltransferase
MTTPGTPYDNRWVEDDHARHYLAIADGIPHRREGEAALLRELELQETVRPLGRVLDVGCGDGRLLDLVLRRFPQATGVAVDFNEEMLTRARDRFAGRPVTVVTHDLVDPLPDLGPFDAVVSSFAIHHVPHERKRALFAEVAAIVGPGGTFANLEHVASATDRLHERFRDEMGIGDSPDDPSNILAPVGDQLRWLQDAGLVDVDCLWKWRELALLVGVRPAG